jgi:hypothetical protein
MPEETRADLATTTVGAEVVQPVAREGAGEAAPVAPVQEPKAEAKPVDLTQSPEFRKWQSERDRTEGQMRQQMTALQQRAQELEQQQYQLATAGMDEPEKAVYENRVLRQQMNQLQAQMQAAQVQGELGAWMEKQLAAGGLTRDEAPDPKEFSSPWAWSVAAQEKAIAKARAEAEAKFRKQQKEERREATTVDTGTGAPTGGERGRLQEQYDKLKGTGRLGDALEIKRKLAALG